MSAHLRKHVRLIMQDVRRMTKPLGVKAELVNGGRHQQIRLRYQASFRIHAIGTSDAHEHIRENCRKAILRLIADLTGSAK